jgi:peptidyl-dipeptidase A
MSLGFAPLLAASVATFVGTLGGTLSGCRGASSPSDAPAVPTAEVAPAPAPPTAEEAKAWIQAVDAEYKRLSVEAARAAWAYQTDITDEHEKVVQATDSALMAFMTDKIKEAVRYQAAPGLDADSARMIYLLRISSAAPAPSDPARRDELAGIKAQMEGAYGKGKFCEKPGCADAEQRDLGWAEDVLAHDRDGDRQLAAWKGWHETAAPQRDRYRRFVELTNEGAREIGFADAGELWRSGYDMSPAAFDAEVERLWQQVKPLYDKLHCHVRAKLSEKYGPDKVDPKAPIPAHLLGNMWAQEWSNLYDLLEPFPKEPDLDLTAGLKRKRYDEMKMVKSAEGFFTSLGLDPLPATFFERSMFVKPAGKEAVCHASAWDVEMNDDLRIKMCIKVDAEDFVTLHHELGHDYYYHYYFRQPALFQTGAHDGFHEGIGDTLALSITPSHLKMTGLLEEVSTSKEATINKQLQDALSKVAFLPFGRMIDKWRWGVFSGEIKPEDYNAAWWKLRETYQGVRAPEARTEASFDPGAKYHIPANTPYMRYFLAHVLQFQFHEALCQAAGRMGPLYQCSIFGSAEAGEKLKAMLAMGASKPWPDALEAIAGTREMDAGAMKRYFAPLEAWLDERNQGRTCGW